MPGPRPVVHEGHGPGLSGPFHGERVPLTSKSDEHFACGAAEPAGPNAPNLELDEDRLLGNVRATRSSQTAQVGRHLPLKSPSQKGPLTCTNVTSRRWPSRCLNSLGGGSEGSNPSGGAPLNSTATPVMWTWPPRGQLPRTTWEETNCRRISARVQAKLTHCLFENIRVWSLEYGDVGSSDCP